MRKTLLAAAISLFAVPAFATSIQNHGAGANATSSAGSYSQATAGSAAVAKGGSAKAKGGSATANGQVTASPSVSVGGDTTKYPHQVAVPSFGGLPSGPCVGAATGVSLGVPIVGGGYQSSTIDDQCTLRENIRLVAQFDKALAFAMLTQLKGVKEAYRPSQESLLPFDEREEVSSSQAIPGGTN